MNVLQTVVTTTLFLPMLFGCGGGEMNTVEMYAQSEVTDADRVIQRKAGVWSALDAGVDDLITSFAVDQYGRLIAGGASVAGVSAVKIAAWDGLAWSALGDGLNSEPLDMIFDANGILYAVGGFTASGAVPMEGVAQWDGAAWTLFADAYLGAAGIDIDPAGNMYVGGAFTEIDSVPAVRVAKWNGTVWAALGAGCNDAVYDVMYGLDGNLYVCGAFTTAGGVAAVGIAKWNGTVWSAVGGDLAGGSATGFKLGQRANGVIILAGSFTSVNGVAANNVASWNGSQWSALGSGVNDYVRSLAFDTDGSLIVGGVFTKIGDLSVGDRVGKWTGSVWEPLSINLPGSAIVTALLVSGDRLFIGYNTSGTAVVSGTGVATITNAGSASTYPKFTITRSGGTSATLQSIINRTTGDELLFDWALLDGETVIIDLTPGRKTITSSFSGNAINQLLPNSDIATWGLISGENDIALYISETGSPTLSAFIQWQTEYESIDGSAS